MAHGTGGRVRGKSGQIARKELEARIIKSLEHIQREIGAVNRALKAMRAAGTGTASIFIPRPPMLVGDACQLPGPIRRKQLAPKRGVPTRGGER